MLFLFSISIFLPLCLWQKCKTIRCQNKTNQKGIANESESSLISVFPRFRPSKIVDSRILNNAQEYRVEWSSSSIRFLTWEAGENLQNHLSQKVLFFLSLLLLFSIKTIVHVNITHTFTEQHTFKLLPTSITKEGQPKTDWCVRFYWKGKSTWITTNTKTFDTRRKNYK